MHFRFIGPVIVSVPAAKKHLPRSKPCSKKAEMETKSNVGPKISPWPARWLMLIAAMICAMVVVGGLTRLTGSGLSITEWQPIMGALPPLNDADWQTAFEKYKLSSQYKLQNQGMALGDFQFIFWWEWGHRLLGRLIGFAFLPLFYLGMRKRLAGGTVVKVLVMFALYIAQAFLGWYMVKSGLVDRVEVSQYRLAAHLTLAMVFFAMTLWTIFGLSKRHSLGGGFDQFSAIVIFALVFTQIAAGAFVAGLDAGQGYNTWPLMDGKYIPFGLDAMQPIWKNLFENALTVQFDHRILAYAIFVLVILHAIKTFRFSSFLLSYAVLMQVGFGILTLLLHVPIAMASIHQIGAIIVLTAATWNLHRQSIA